MHRLRTIVCLCLMPMLIVFSEWSASAELVGVAKVLDTPPDNVWNHAEHTGTNSDLVDNDPRDNIPDGWTLEDGAQMRGVDEVELGPATDNSTEKKTPALYQNVVNDEKVNYTKEVVVGMTYSGEAGILRVTSANPNGKDAPSAIVKLQSGQGTKTKYVVLKMKYQPAEEKVKISQTSTDQWAKAQIDNVEIRTKCVERCKENSKKGAPQARHSNSSQVNYDAVTQTLTFGDATIDTLNLNGLDIMDPAFSNDPILGSSISVTGLMLSDQEGGGYYFENGTLTVQKDGFVFLQAEIPWLYVDDQATSLFGDNVYGELGEILADFSQNSAWLEQFAERQRTQEDWAEFRANTASPLESAIGGSYSVQTTASLDLAFCVPEPSTIILLAFVVIGLLVHTWRRRK